MRHYGARRTALIALRTACDAKRVANSVRPHVLAMRYPVNRFGSQPNADATIEFGHRPDGAYRAPAVTPRNNLGGCLPMADNRD